MTREIKVLRGRSAEQAHVQFVSGFTGLPGIIEAGSDISQISRTKEWRLSKFVLVVEWVPVEGRFDSSSNQLVELSSSDPYIKRYNGIEIERVTRPENYHGLRSLGLRGWDYTTR